MLAARAGEILAVAMGGGRATAGGAAAVPKVDRAGEILGPGHQDPDHSQITGQCPVAGVPCGAQGADVHSLPPALPCNMLELDDYRIWGACDDTHADPEH